ncbi:hypothetical protein D3C78_1485090 [compost metagenome]
MKLKLGRIQSETALLEQQRQELEQKIVEEPEQPIPLNSIHRVLADFKPVLQNATPNQQKALFRSMLAKVILPTDGDITQMIIQGSEALLNMEIPNK